MSIQEDFKAYTNSLGFLSNSPAGSSGNDLLFSCEAAIIRSKLGAWSKEDQSALEKAVLDHSYREAGLYGRPGKPWCNDQEGFDDYIGVLAWSAKFDKGLRALRVLLYGQRNKFDWKGFRLPYYYRTEHPYTEDDKRAWFGRSPSFVAHLYWSAGLKPGWFYRLAWAISVATSGNLYSKDPWILSWLLVEVAQDKGLLERLATRIFKYRLRKRGGLKFIFCEYFGSMHPIALHCPISGKEF